MVCFWLAGLSAWVLGNGDLRAFYLWVLCLCFVRASWLIDWWLLVDLDLVLDC